MREFWVQQAENFPSQLKGQWLRNLQGHRLIAANLIILKDWLESTAFIHEDLLAQTNSKFHSREKPKKVLSPPTLVILVNQWIQNVLSKMDSTQSGVVRNLNQCSWTSDENMCINSKCVSIAWDLAIGQRIAKKEPTVCQILDDNTTNFSTATSKRNRLQQVPQILRQQ